MSAIRERAQAAKARAEAATPADWIYGSILDGKRTIYARAEEEDGDNPVIAYDVPTADADFIVEAREDVPALADFALRVTDPGMRQRLRPLYVASRAEVLALTQERARLGEELNRAQAAVTEMQALMVRVSEGYRDRDQRSAARAREWEEHLRGLLAALRQAQAALTWGHAEMKGRPPQHWLDAMAAVARALDPSSGLPEEGPEAPGAVQGSAVSPEQAAQERDRDG